MTDCSVEGCGTTAFCRGWCRTHYNRWYRYGDVAFVPERRAPGGRPCSAPGCEQIERARGRCAQHRARRWAHGCDEPFKRPPSGSDHPSWRGGIDPRGYARVSVGGRTTLAHRAVMAQVLGRELRPGENVHHINGDRADNRPENLELWSTVQPAGQRVADKMAWAWQMVELYGQAYPRPPLSSDGA